MSNELIAILSLGVTTLGVVAACAALMLTQTRNLRADLTKLIEDQGTVLGKRIEDQGTALNKRLDGQAIEIAEIKKEVYGLREGLHGLGKRMAHLEGLVEGLKEAVVARFAA